MPVERAPHHRDGSVPDAPEELLPVPRRSRRGGWWLVAALLAAGLTGWALTRSSDTPVPAHRGRPAPVVSTLADPACRGLAGCSVRTGVPRVIARLARAYLQPGMQLRVRTVFADGPPAHPKVFVARDIDARIDSVSVLIRVQRGGSGTREIAPDPLGIGSLLLHRVSDGFVVRLQYLAPETVPPMLARLRALMRDPRLTAG